jgi:hypothetical protein
MGGGALALSDHSSGGIGDNGSISTLASTPHMKVEKRDSGASKDINQSSFLDSIKSTQQSFLEPLKDDDLERLKDW